MGREVADRRSPADRAHAFIDAWHHMPMGGEAEFRIGRSTDGEASILISIHGSEHVFRASEARVLVEIIDSTIEKYPVEAAEIGCTTMRAGILETLKVAEAA